MESSLGDYMVGVSIGQGSFGTVYHGIHKETRREVAIKLFDKVSLKKHPEWRDNVLNEQRLLRKLADCPFVATLLASFHDDQFVYLVLECYKKGTLSHCIEQKSKMEEQVWLHHAVTLALGIADAIEAVHGYDIIHADLSPDNILITGDARSVIITDFGSALFTNEITPGRSVPLRGTAEYAAPELIRASSIPTKAVDMWSVGCLIHTLWTGESPFHAESEALIVDKVTAYADGDDDTSANFGSSIPFRVLNLIQQLLDPIPKNRCGYSIIRSVLESTDEFKNKLAKDEFNLLISDPAWTHESSRSTMKDGILGWKTFLL